MDSFSKNIRRILIDLIVPIIIVGIAYYAASIIFNIDVEILVKDGEKSIEGVCLSFNGKDITSNTFDKEDRVKINFIRKGDNIVEVEMNGFKKSAERNDYHTKSKTIYINSIDNYTPFSFQNWNVWENDKLLGVTKLDDNTISITGIVTSTQSGYVSEHLNRSIAGKILKLNFYNTKNSTFSNERMIKVTFNINDSILQPQNLLFGEYLSANEDSALYYIPNHFDGKLGFVFSNCTLNNLKISASIK
jgi:hypothetical protein